MQDGRPVSFLKLSWQELIFLFGYFFLLPIVSQLQYMGMFPDDNPLSISLIYTLLSGFLSFLPKLFYYMVIIPCLFRKKYVLFTVYTLLYLVVFDFYLKYAVDLMISEMRFLPRGVWGAALGGYNHSKGKLIRQSISLTFMDLTVLLALAYFVRSGKQEREILDLRKNRMLSELDYLKAQINPAFFFNTLGNIHSLAVKGSGQTASVVARLSEIMRYVLYQSAAKVSLQQELGFTTNYIEAERVRLYGRMNISFDVQGKTDTLMIEPLLFIPLIERALDSTAKQQASTEIVILISGYELTMEVKSDVSFSAAADKIIQRLDLLYPGRYSLRLSDHEISLNLELNHEH